MDANYPLALAEGTILNGEYIIKKVLGQGGFGITYEAAVHKSSELVAIKEYLPDSMASRTQTMVTPYTGDRGSNFDYGKQCFLEEAKTLAQFNDNPGVVGVKKYFEENGTAYFVMEYIQGKSYKQYLEEKGGRIPIDEAIRILTPVMDALSAVHAKGIIHRDVTPDNIYITDSGQVKLLDFGAARYSLGDRSRSLDVVLKHGFAPKEQYTRHGRQGPYTDVYSLAVTVYKSITGRLIPDSIDRLEEDEMVMPGALGVSITDGQENALLKALAVDYKDRYQSMAEFKAALTGQQYAGPAVQSSGNSEIVFTQQQNTVQQPNTMQQPSTVQQPGTLQQPNAVQQQSAVKPVKASNDKSGKQKGIIIGVIAASAVIVAGIIIATVLILGKNKAKEAAAVTEPETLPVEETSPAEETETAKAQPETSEEVAETAASSDIKKDEGTVNFKNIDVDSLTASDEYSFPDFGIAFKCSEKLASDKSGNAVELTYPGDYGQNKSIYVINYGKCGEVETYPSILSELSDSVDLDYLSDLIPLTIGNYPGWYVSYDQVIPPETYNQGVVFLLTPYVGVKRQMCIVFGEYDDVMSQIISTFEIEGAHAEDLSGVNTSKTYKVPHYDPYADEEIYIFADSSSRALDRKDIDDLYDKVKDTYNSGNMSGTIDQYMAKMLCYGRNEIFARNGRKFSSPELQDYFDGMDWYTPKYEPNQFDYADLTNVEKKNVDFIKEYENKYGGYTPKK